MKPQEALGHLLAIGAKDRMEVKHSHLERQVCELYERFHGSIYRYALSMGSLDPDEVCQECFFRLYSQLRAGETIRTPKVWLFRVAHNLTMDRFRELSHLSDMNNEVWNEVLLRGDPGPNPEQALLENERSKRIEKALRDLTPLQLEVLHLRAEGLRYRQIAEIQNVTLSAVSNCAARAIERLRAELHA